MIPLDAPAYGELVAELAAERRHLAASEDSRMELVKTLETRTLELSAVQTLNTRLLAALRSAIAIADEAQEEWDKAPAGMRAGKILLALAGHLRGYRPDTDAIHLLVMKATGEQS